MSPKYLAPCLVALLAFSSGIAVGQRTAPSRFEMYDGPTSFTEMETRLLAANLDIAQEQLEYSPGIGLPVIFYDRNTRKLRAQSHVSPKFVNEQKTSDVKQTLLSAALTAQATADQFFPEVKAEFPDPDFEVEFFHVGWDAEKKAGKRVVYAEYKRGELTIYHGK